MPRFLRYGSRDSILSIWSIQHYIVSPSSRVDQTPNFSIILLITVEFMTSWVSYDNCYFVMVLKYFLMYDSFYFKIDFSEICDLLGGPCFYLMSWWRCLIASYYLNPCEIDQTYIGMLKYFIVVILSGKKNIPKNERVATSLILF